MTFAQVMKELKKRGTAQNVKIYKRHGSGDNVFGVSFAHLNDLKKKIGVDYDLALQLWESGNVDARSLATMLADPAKMSVTVANRWVKDIEYYLLADLVSGVIAKTSFAMAKMDSWMKSRKEFVRQCGYDVLATLLKLGADISDAKCKAYLKTIEKEIHASPNRARHAMNTALLAIGINRTPLSKTAIATAKRIGKVHVDHGETSCKTPDAVSYIEKALKRKKK